MIKLNKLSLFILGLFFFIGLSACGKKDSSTSKNDKLNSPTNFEEALKQDLSQGQKQYHLRGCAKCHGLLGDGQGSKALFLGIDPRDFRDPSSFLQGASLEKISQTIKTGITNNKRSPMPKYPFLTTEEREQIALYVLYLSTNNNHNKNISK